MTNTQPRKTGRPILRIIIVLAIALRAAVALFMGDQVVELPGIQDQISYNALALRLLGGHGYSFDVGWYPFTPANTPTAHWSFAYPAFLAAVYGIFGHHPLAARLIQAVIVGALTCWLIYRLSARVFGHGVGLMAAGIAAFYSYFVYYSAALMTESFYMVAALAALELAHLLSERPTIGRAALLGLSLGLAVLLRQAILLFIPALLAWLWWEGRSRLRWHHYVMPLIVVALMVAPWTLRNYRVYGGFLLLNSNAGYAFYSSNHPAIGADWTTGYVVSPVPADVQGHTEAFMDRALMRRGVEFVVADPWRYVLLSLSRNAEYFKFWPSQDSGLISNLQRLMSFALLLPLALIGMWLARRRLRQWALPLLFFVFTAATYVLSWPSARYRVPTDACLMPLAALGLIYLYSRISAIHRFSVGRQTS